MCPLFLGLQLFSNHFTHQRVPTGNGAVRPKGLLKFRFLKLFPSISSVLGSEGLVPGSIPPPSGLLA